MFVAADDQPATVNLWDEARIPAPKDRDGLFSRAAASNS